jgi:peptidoglycan-associated lipoprotein
VIGVGCAKKVVATTGGTPQVAAPVAPPAPPKPAPQQAKAEPPKQTAPAPQQPKPAEPKKLTPQQRADLNALLAKMADAFFDYNQTTIRTDATAALDQNVGVIRDILKDYPTEKLLIEGHADERGSSEYNLALADRRSRSAQDFLSSKGIPQTQLSVISYGEERPTCRDASEACYQQNRRVHITVAP